ncbi:MAG: SET domain-containing protein [Hydrogenophaga sp.]|uniref:SET domain-containing protein n=1 Tax=Hydrogenophaga sp. TaxID=1904254 RepID=UPI00260F50B0|nr:SET domain-containing protein [Hydrogenophaga sp.]MCV0439691.1 SET domain-containing protein [Hydrogenophaga sp.]
MLILKPSTNAGGVGIFTTRAIRSGEPLHLFADEDWRFVTEEDLKDGERFLVRRFGIPEKNGWHIPADWNHMSIGWYLNHADLPNVHHKDYVYYASRHIRRGEELYLDYESLV